MADEMTPRAVSGEIMTYAAQDRPAAQRDGDVIDAEFFVLPGREATVAPVVDPPSSPIVAAIGMDMLRRQPETAQQKPVRGGPLFWATGVSLAAAAFWVSGGHELVRTRPFLAMDAPDSALRVSGVTSRVETSGARPLLFVDGEAANDGTSPEQLPPLEIAVTGKDGRVTRYRLGTSGRPLDPGQTFAFSSRLDVPKNGVKTVSVTISQ